MAKKTSENKKKNVNTKTKAKENTNKIVGWIAAIAALVMVVVVVVAVVLNNRGLDESYFVSDDTKYVMTLGSDELGADEEEYAPDKVYVVYDYDTEKVTGMRVYYEYADNATAKEAYDYARSMSDDEGDFEGFSLNGRYLVMEMESYNYDNLTVDAIKMLIEMEEAGSQGADWSADGWTEVIDEDDDTSDESDESDDANDNANTKNTVNQD